MLPKARSPDRDKAKEIYLQHNGDIPLAEIAAQLNVPEGTVRGWKNKDRWDGKSNGTFRKNTERSKRDKKVHKQLAKAVEENDDLTDQQKEFCLHYVQIYNQTQAAINAGYSPQTAYSIGYNLMHNPKVRAEIARLKAIKAEAILAGPEDIIDRLMRIAFADINNFVEFGRIAVPIMTKDGPLMVPDLDNPGKLVPAAQEVNDMRFKESWMVDGGIISQIKVGKDGASIKLEDRMKAYDKLFDYFEMNPQDRRKQEYDKRRLEIELIRAQAFMKPSGEESLPDDGFTNALNGQAADNWQSGDDSTEDNSGGDNDDVV